MDEHVGGEPVNDREGLLIAHGEAVDKAFARAVREALARHKREGNVIAVWRDGGVVLLNPDELTGDSDGEDE